MLVEQFRERGMIPSPQAGNEVSDDRIGLGRHRVSLPAL
jgi:hypothetical protein